MKQIFIVAFVLSAGAIFWTRSADAVPVRERPWLQMLADGFEHNFGKVPRGTQCAHVFRIVNTTGEMMEIRSIRTAAGSCVRVRSNQMTLRPREQTEIEMLVDTRLFINSRTIAVWVTVQKQGVVTEEIRFWLQVFSEEAVGDEHGRARLLNQRFRLFEWGTLLISG